MIIKCDARQLEWRSYVEWSSDPIGIAEILDNVDVHAINQSVFKLPSRLIAKIFLFRWIYRGSAWAYANDADFIETSSSENFWQTVIDKANEKYSTLYSFQNKLIERVEHGERISIPTGREYEFELTAGKYGDWGWNVRDIVNWPNQGYSADLMVMARISARDKLRKLKEYNPNKIKLINTVHDDIQLDVVNDPKVCYNICTTMLKVFEDIPKDFKKLYGISFKVPMAAEVSYGPNLFDLVEFDPSRGVNQFL